MNEDFEFRRAKKRVRAKKGFFYHLASYAIIIGFLFLINMVTGPSDVWFIFPALGWGVGLAFHYIGVFGVPFFNFGSAEWEEKELEKELQKQQTRPQNLLETRPTSLKITDELELKEMQKRYDENDFV